MSPFEPAPAAPRAAEFFAGIGLVRSGLNAAGIDVVFANDNDPSKRDLYQANFGNSEFTFGDVQLVHAENVPEIDIATASFPCTDLSLAGNRAGLAGAASGLFWEFARVLREMRGQGRLPPIALLENVPSWATSRNGEDLRTALAELNDLGYWCDILVVDARRFVPQSRPRLFIVCFDEPLPYWMASDWRPSVVRPPWVEAFVDRNSDLQMHALQLVPPPTVARTLDDVVERLSRCDGRWWDLTRLGGFLTSLSPLQAERLEQRVANEVVSWATAYRRTRAGRPMWEVRKDSISGCLRTARGGSSKQALVEAGDGAIRVRWMTSREYARLQGVAEAYDLSAVTENRALFALGDAVCVPAVNWLARAYLRPLLERRHSARRPQPRAVSFA